MTTFAEKFPHIATVEKELNANPYGGLFHRMLTVAKHVGFDMLIQGIDAKERSLQTIDDWIKDNYNHAK